MKKVTDLKRNEAIHCPTKEIFEKIISLNPTNDCKVCYWDKHKENTVYYPADYNRTGAYDGVQYHEKNEYTPIYPHTDFILDLPERGEIIEVWDNDEEDIKERIFVGYIEGALYPVVCVNSADEKKFKDGEKFNVTHWENFKRLNKKDDRLSEIAEELGLQIEKLKELINR